MANDWEIKARADRCSVTGREFTEGEFFYTLLFFDKQGYRREDLSEEAWQARGNEAQPFSFWRSKFEPPLPPPPEALEKQTAEDLLRQYMHEGPEHANTRYILGVMLERKRILKQTDTREDESGRTLIYMHVKSGEVFVIPDPGLRLDQLAEVQTQVASLLK